MAQSIRQWINVHYYRRKISFDDTTRVSTFSSLLEAGTPFSFSRYGDGEWRAILGNKGRNCDGHEYFPEMAHQLRDALIHPGSYFFGMQNYAMRKLGRQLYHFIRKNGISITWHNSDVFHYASLAGELFPLISALRGKEVVMVGPSYLTSLPTDFFPVSHCITVPESNCFLAIDAIEKNILAYAKNHDNIVYAFSASMAANCMIHHLYPRIGASNWLIDFGSLWDCYINMDSRGYLMKYDWKALKRKNTNQ